MIVLGIDTSGYANAVGLVKNGRVLADRVYPAATDSLEQIVANIDEVVTGAGLTVRDVQGIGVGLGPGSWTGIRVGVTVGKMLAFGLGKPVAGITTFDALATATGVADKPVCTIIGAGTRDTVYAAFFRGRDGNMSRESEYFVGSVRELAASFTGPVVVAGPDAQKYMAEMNALTDGKIAVTAIEVGPRGAMVAHLAARRLERGDGDDRLALSPLYLKESSAKSLAERHRLGGR